MVCPRCGAENPEGAAACGNCGTEIIPPAADSTAIPSPVLRPPVRSGALPKVTLLLVILLTLALLTAALLTALFLPVKSVSLSEQREVPHIDGVQALSLKLSSDVARVRVSFDEALPVPLTMEVTVEGRVGVASSTDLLNLSFDYDISGDLVTVSAAIGIRQTISLGLSLDVRCDVRMDPALRINLDIENEVGSVEAVTAAGLVLDSSSIRTTTGSIRLDMEPGTILGGDLSVRTTTGKVVLIWADVAVNERTNLGLSATTGEISVALLQTEPLEKDVRVDAEATTGKISLDLEIFSGTGARVVSGSDVGSVRIEHRIGFEGVTASLESLNYPAAGNFDINLQTTVGGIELDLEYRPWS